MPVRPSSLSRLLPASVSADQGEQGHRQWGNPESAPGQEQFKRAQGQQRAQRTRKEHSEIPDDFHVIAFLSSLIATAGSPWLEGGTTGVHSVPLGRGSRLENY